MLGGIMAKAGLQRCISDEGVFVPTPNTTLPPTSELAIGLWVDDLIGISPTNEALDKIEASIEKYVELEKREKPKKVLGIEVNWKALAPYRAHLLQTRLHQPCEPEGIPSNCQKFSVHSSDNTPGDIYSCQPLRTTHNSSKHTI
jgi:hypothetical protein